MQILNYFEDAAQRMIKTSPWTNVYGLARTMLALGTCLTLLFNDIRDLIPTIGSVAALQPHLGAQKISLFYLFTYEHINAARFLAVGILVLVMSGWRPRITGILHFWVCFSIISSVPLIDGGDQIANNISLLMVPITLSDPRKWHWQSSIRDSKTSLVLHNISSLFAHSCVWMIRLQMAVIYFNSGIAKLNVPEWANGTALYYWCGHNIFGMPLSLRPILMPIFSQPVPVVLLTWGVILFEVLLFVAFFLPKKQWGKFLIAGIVFHFSIWFVHGLCSFFFVMLAGLIVYLRPVEKIFFLSYISKTKTKRELERMTDKRIQV